MVYVQFLEDDFLEELKNGYGLDDSFTDCALRSIFKELDSSSENYELDSGGIRGIELTYHEYTLTGATNLFGQNFIHYFDGDSYAYIKKLENGNYLVRR